jgi:SAM-dependent methyltransferase
VREDSPLVEERPAYTRPLTAERKADFGSIYTRSDPREYFRVLNGLDYQIPQQALPVFRSVLAASREERGNRTVLDLCCSYGINSALLYSREDPFAVTARYADPRLAAITPRELADRDLSRYADSRDDVRVVGLDTSASAIRYATNAGLLTAGWTENLESSVPSEALVAGIADVGLIICTGGVGYVGYRTFGRLLASLPSPEDLWLAVFVLRVFDYAPIAALLSAYGLETEKLPGTFRQRRFVDAAEREACLHDIKLRGLDPSGLEEDGWYHADCFLTRPAAAARVPAAALVGDPAENVNAQRAGR